MCLSFDTPPFRIYHILLPKNTNVTPDIYYATKSSYNATNYT